MPLPVHSRRRAAGRLASCFLALGLAAAAHAAPVELLVDRKPAERPGLLVAGLPHFANPGKDIVNVEIDDMLAPKRQREIERFVEQLAAYRPTRVAVEWPIGKQDKLDERYRAYRDGTYALSRNEIDQIGLRLAAKLGLERVDAVDWSEDPPGVEADYDFMTWANANGQGELLRTLFAAKLPEPPFAQTTLHDYACALARPDRIALSHRVYFDYAMIGDSKAYPGATWVGHWYARNLRIFANLVRIAPRSADRVVAVFGAGHTALLQEYGRQSGAFKVDDFYRVMRCR